MPNIAKANCLSRRKTSKWPINWTKQLSSQQVPIRIILPNEKRPIKRVKSKQWSRLKVWTGSSRPNSYLTNNQQLPDRLLLVKTTKLTTSRKLYILWTDRLMTTSMITFWTINKWIQIEKIQCSVGLPNMVPHLMVSDSKQEDSCQVTAGCLSNWK